MRKQRIWGFDSTAEVVQPAFSLGSAPAGPTLPAGRSIAPGKSITPFGLTLLKRVAAIKKAGDGGFCEVMRAIERKVQGDSVHSTWTKRGVNRRATTADLRQDLG